MDNLIGKTLDGLYTIQELIGAGGMANVYKAVVSAPGGPVPEGTVVAVKVLRQELMHDADLVRRFKNESKAISLLNHPNIVKVYDVSVSENLQYIVMECVEGMTLREYLNERGGKITSRETVHFIAQILRALASPASPGPRTRSRTAKRPWAASTTSAPNRRRGRRPTPRATSTPWAS